MIVRDFFGDHRRFFLVIQGHDEADVVVAFVVAPEGLGSTSDVVFDQRVGRVQDGRGAAVVLLQLDDVRIGEEALKLEDVGDVGTAPAVDGLVVIAHDTDVERRTYEGAEQSHLDGVGVLKLIHHDILVDGSAGFSDVLVLLKELHAEDEEVVEVHGVERTELALVGLINGGVGVLGGITQGGAAVLNGADAGLGFGGVVGLLFCRAA